MLNKPADEDLELTLENDNIEADDSEALIQSAISANANAETRKRRTKNK